MNNRPVVVLTTTAASALGVVIANVTRPGELLQGVIDGEPAADRTEVVVDDGGSVGQRLVERLRT